MRAVGKGDVPVDGDVWLVIERSVNGKFFANGTAPGAERPVYFPPAGFDTLREAVAACQSWAFHHDVPVIYVVTD